MNPPLHVLWVGAAAPDLSAASYGPFDIHSCASLEAAAQSLRDTAHDAVLLWLAPGMAMALADWQALSHAVLDAAVVVVAPDLTPSTGHGADAARRAGPAARSLGRRRHAGARAAPGGRAQAARARRAQGLRHRPVHRLAQPCAAAGAHDAPAGAARARAGADGAAGAAHRRPVHHRTRAGQRGGQRAAPQAGGAGARRAARQRRGGLDRQRRLCRAAGLDRRAGRRHARGRQAGAVAAAAGARGRPGPGGRGGRGREPVSRARQAGRGTAAPRAGPGHRQRSRWGAPDTGAANDED